MQYTFRDMYDGSGGSDITARYWWLSYLSSQLPEFTRIYNIVNADYGAGTGAQLVDTPSTADFLLQVDGIIAVAQGAQGWHQPVVNPYIEPPKPIPVAVVTPVAPILPAPASVAIPVPTALGMPLGRAPMTFAEWVVHTHWWDDEKSIRGLSGAEVIRDAYVDYVQDTLATQFPDITGPDGKPWMAIPGQVTGAIFPQEDGYGTAVYAPFTQADIDASLVQYPQLKESSVLPARGPGGLMYAPRAAIESIAALSNQEHGVFKLIDSGMLVMAMGAVLMIYAAPWSGVLEAFGGAPVASPEVFLDPWDLLPDPTVMYQPFAAPVYSPLDLPTPSMPSSPEIPWNGDGSGITDIVQSNSGLPNTWNGDGSGIEDIVQSNTLPETWNGDGSGINDIVQATSVPPVGTPNVSSGLPSLTSPGGLIPAAGSAAAALLRALSNSGALPALIASRAINPLTGLPYSAGINPATGLPYDAMGATGAGGGWLNEGNAGIMMIAAAGALLLMSGGRESSKNRRKRISHARRTFQRQLRHRR